MAGERAFVEDALRRTLIDEFLAAELRRAGYGGMEVARTPQGTELVLWAEKPGMVIGKGGKTIRTITAELETRFDLDDLQVDVRAVEEPDLDARIVADRLANALERGWYYRNAGQTTVDQIMEAGAKGAEIVLSGKVTGARSRVEKFTRGTVKHNGEPAAELVDVGQSEAIRQLGTVGVTVRLIPPAAELPDDFHVRTGVDVDNYVSDSGQTDGVGQLGDTAPTDGLYLVETTADETNADEIDTDETSGVDGMAVGDESSGEQTSSATDQAIRTESDGAVENGLDADTDAAAEQLVDEMSTAEPDAQGDESEVD